MPWTCSAFSPFGLVQTQGYYNKSVKPGRYCGFLSTGPSTHSLDKLWLPLRHLIHRMLPALRHQPQAVTIPLAVLDPHVRKGRILDPAMPRRDLLLLAQQPIQLHGAEECRPPRRHLHAQPAAVIPVHRQIRTGGQLHGAQRGEARGLALVERRVHVPALELRVARFERGSRGGPLVPVVARAAFGGEVLDAVGVGALVALADQAHVGSGWQADHLSFLSISMRLSDLWPGI